MSQGRDNIPVGWVETTLGKETYFVNDKILLSKVNTTNYVSTENLLSDRLGKINATTLPSISKVNHYQKGDTLFSNIRTYFKKVWHSNDEGGSSNDVLIFRPKNTLRLDNKFLFFFISSDYFIDFTVKSAKGTKMPRGDKNAMSTFSFNLPPLQEQKAIANVLSAFDDKIENLRAQNDTLEQTAQTIFTEWFQPSWLAGGKYQLDDELPEGWRVGKLSEIADFLNGLALQKFPPVFGQKNLPVIKIRELKQGITSQTDQANTDLDKKYIVKNGDILFSWSGSLEVVIWQYGEGALNQHLFKVTSKDFPKWFYYHWIIYHLNEFRSIASSKATTMGHINRNHLDLANVIIPNEKIFKKLNELFSPLIEKIETNNQQIQSLSQTRDTLLPKLMSGQLRVKEV